MFTNPSDDLEQFVTTLQDDVKNVIDGHGEVWRQAAYQYLYGLGHRIPTDPHNELRRLSKKVQTT